MESAFYRAGSIEQVAINLFYGWGYNFYRQENQLRADDLMVRSRICELLGGARAWVEAAESGYRRDYLPAPSREHPRPDPQCVHNARALEALSRDIGSLEGAVRVLPVPETDRMTQRYRSEGGTLLRLLEADQDMVGRAEMLRAGLASVDGVVILASMGQVRAALAGLCASVGARRDLLSL